MSSEGTRAGGREAPGPLPGRGPGSRRAAPGASGLRGELAVAAGLWREARKGWVSSADVLRWRLLALAGGMGLLGAALLVADAFPAPLAGVSILVLTGILFHVVLRAFEAHERTQLELGRAHREMGRRVEERTRELAQANRALQEKVREVEMTESLLRRSEEYYRALIENASDLVVLLRPDGRIRYHSPSVRRVLGWEGDDVWDRGFAEFMHEDDLSQALEMFSRVLEAGGRTERQVLRVRTRDGGHRHLETMAHNLLDDPAVGGVILNLRDLTERIEMEGVVRAQEAQLRQAQKMEAVGRLAGGVAHDFNNVLTIIGGHAEFLADRIPPADPLHGEAVEIGEAVERAARLTRQLLMFSRCEVAQPRMLDVNAVVDTVDQLARRLIPEGTRLVTRLRSRRWRVLMDAGHLEQVLMNLVVNARDALLEPGRRAGTIAVETDDRDVATLLRTPLGDLRPGRYVVLTVRDDGCGIPAEIQDRIFDPFFTTKGTGGTGLGLSTVFGIVRDAGGVVTVESRVGAGAAFRIHLPGHDDPGVGAETPEEAEPGPVIEGETVLYVEDEDRLRALTARTLRELGYVVLSTANGPDALRISDLYREPIDLLLSDVVMPEMTGPELHAELEARRGRVPVLFVSGYPGEELSRRGFEGGSLLAKPYGSRALLREVRRVLDEG